jgi:hypothetical protein
MHCAKVKSSMVGVARNSLFPPSILADPDLDYANVVSHPRFQRVRGSFFSRAIGVRGADGVFCAGHDGELTGM